MRHQYNLFGLRSVWALMLAFAASALLSSCGGGGSGAGGQGGTQFGGSTQSGAATMQVTASSPSIGSAATSTVTISAIVKDSSNRALANQVVGFSMTDTGASLGSISTKTDATGISTAVLSITDKSNRPITVTATTGSVTQTVVVNVVGTSLTLNGPSSIVTAGSANFTIALRDSGQSPISGAVISVSSTAGNALSAATVTTDATGQAQFAVTATKTGSDTIKATALGATASSAINVSGNSLIFEAPANSAQISVNTTQAVTVRFQPSTGSASGQTLQFAATRGTLSAPSGVTDANGRVTVNIFSSTAGLSTITATAPGGTTTTSQVDFVSLIASTIALQASPASVGANLSASGTNSSQLIARVRDATGNPVEGVRVDFSQVIDPSSGSINPPFAITDSAGVATVSFIAGPNSSGFNGVQVKATVFGTSINATAPLTVAQLQLFVRISSTNQLELPDNTKFTMPWTAVVTDSNGNPVSNASVQASWTPLRFYKGTFGASGSSWQRNKTADCISEDANGNSVLDTGEDTNLNSQLTPGNIASVTVSSAGSATDASGFADIKLTYGRSYNLWAKVRLRVTIASQGTEGSDQADFDLPALSADLTNLSNSMPGDPSPFGALAGCDNTN